VVKTTPPLSPFLKDLEDLYKLALKKGSLATALRAKELLGREQGFFKSSPHKGKLSLRDFSDEDLQLLIEEIKTYLQE